MTTKLPKTKNAAKNKKSAKPKPANPSHVPTPWLKLKQMWEAGESYEAMAKATDAHYSANKPDPTKPTRAKIWKARNIGVNIDGKLVRFGGRGKAKEAVKKGNRSKGVKKQSSKVKAATKISKQMEKPVDSKPEPSRSAESVDNGTET